MQQSGLSAVELLITLFVGLLFVMMGYQLFSTSITTTGSASSRAEADTAVTGYLIYWKLNNNMSGLPDYTTDCSTMPKTYAPTWTYSGYGGTHSYTFTASCPSATVLPKLRLLTLTSVHEGETASHAIYITLP